jgi:hypothetical protein
MVENLAAPQKALRLYEDYWPSTLPPNTYRDWINERGARRKAERLADLRQPRRGCGRPDHPDGIKLAVPGGSVSNSKTRCGDVDTFTVA